MKIREKEELTVEQLGEMEQPRDMHLSSTSVAALDLLQMPQNETQDGEPQAGFAGEANSVKESGPTNGNIKSQCAITAGVNLDCCEPQIQQCVISCEEHASEMDSAETEKQSKNVGWQMNDDGAERHGNKDILENGNFRGVESDLQRQDNSLDFTKTKMATTTLQQKPKNSEEVEVETTEVEGASTGSQPQANITSGKKKKKKRKGKKKGRADEDSQKDKNEDDTAEKYERMNQLQLTAVDGVLATEIPIEPRSFTDNVKINPQQIEAEDPERKEKNAVAELEELECMAGNVSHTVASQEIAMERSLVLDVQTSGTGGAEETAGTTENHSGDGLSEESGMGHPEEKQNLGKDSLETETIIPAPIDDPGFQSPSVNDIREVNKQTLNPNNPCELTDVLMTDGGANPSDAQDNTTFIDNESESGKGEAKLKQNLEGELQAASAEAPPAPETSDNETSLSKSSTDGLSGSHALSESLTATQPGPNTNITVSVSQDGEESEQEAVTAKKEEDGRDESLAGDLVANTDLPDHVTSPNLVTEADNTMSKTQIDDDDNDDSYGESALGVRHESEARIVDMSEAPDGPTEADGSVKRQSSDGTSEDLSPNLWVTEVGDDDDEGQSFEFDDLDLEVAFTAKTQPQGKEEGGQALCDDRIDRGSVLDRIDSESKDNAQPEVVGSDGEKAVNPNGQADFHQTDATPANNENVCGNPKKEEPEVDQQPATQRIGPATGEKPDWNPTKVLVVEESVDAAKHDELQDEQSASEKEPLQQQARKDSKKNSKKGKSKGKEDCKMS